MHSLIHTDIQLGFVVVSGLILIIVQAHGNDDLYPYYTTCWEWLQQHAECRTMSVSKDMFNVLSVFSAVENCGYN